MQSQGKHVGPCPHGPHGWPGEVAALRTLWPLTNDDEGHSNGIGQQVATHWLIVLAIAFAEEADQRVQLVYAQALWAQDDGLTPWPGPAPSPPLWPPGPQALLALSVTSAGHFLTWVPASVS